MDANESSSWKQSRASTTNRHEPKIEKTLLQLFLNASKLLDLALILPSDTLPQFQLHRWAFLGDSSNSTSFDITTIFTALSKADMGLPLDTISIFSADDQQFASLGTVSSNIDSMAGGDSASLHSSSTHDSSQGATSLPPILASVNGRSQMKNYIPHIVIINSILNYLSVSNRASFSTFDCNLCPSIQGNGPTSSPADLYAQLNNAIARSKDYGLPSTAGGPLLTMSSIDTIYDLQFFFNSLISRSLQHSLHQLSCASNRHTPQASRRSTRPSSVVHLRAAATQLFSKNASSPRALHSAAHFKLRGEKKKDKKKLNVKDLDGPEERTRKSGVDYSLEELFLNIDQIIANDFLEPSE